MHVEYHELLSPILARPMRLEVYGHWGVPIMAFPSSYGRADQFAGFGSMVHAVRHHVEGGRVKIFCVDAADTASWYNDDAHPGHRSWAYSMYVAHIMNEVVPYIDHHCRSPGIPITAVGCSFGAYHAMNITLKFPWRFDRVIAMSGRYDIRAFVPGYSDMNVYFNNPMDYIGGVGPGPYLDRLRRIDIRLVCGQGPWEHPHFTRDFSALLDQKGIPHWLDLWGHDVKHDWDWWQRQFDHHLHHI